MCSVVVRGSRVAGWLLMWSVAAGCSWWAGGCDSVVCWLLVWSVVGNGSYGLVGRLVGHGCVSGLVARMGGRQSVVCGSVGPRQSWAGRRWARRFFARPSSQLQDLVLNQRRLEGRRQWCESKCWSALGKHIERLRHGCALAHSCLNDVVRKAVLAWSAEGKEAFCLSVILVASVGAKPAQAVWL